MFYSRLGQISTRLGRDGAGQQQWDPWAGLGGGEEDRPATVVGGRGRGDEDPATTLATGDQLWEEEEERADWEGREAHLLPTAPTPTSPCPELGGPVELPCVPGALFPWVRMFSPPFLSCANFSRSKFLFSH